MYLKLGKRIVIHKFCLFMPAAVLISGNAKFYFLTLCSAFCHELAHLCAAKVSGERTDKFFFLPHGFELRLKRPVYSSETAIFASGPLMSIALAIAGYYLHFGTFARANLFIFFLNILPAYPLDGGKLIRILLWRVYGVYYGNRILRYLSFSVSALLALCAARLLSAWLCGAAVTVAVRSRNISGSPFCGKSINNAPARIFIASQGETLIDILRFFSPYYRVFVYVRESNTVFSESDIISFTVKNGCGAYIGTQTSVPIM